MNDAINQRTDTVLKLLCDGQPHGRREIVAAINESPSTVNRLLADLVERGWIVSRGKARSLQYVLTPRGRVEVRLDLGAYLKRPPSERALFTTVQPTFFDLFAGSMPPQGLERFGAARARYHALSGTPNAAEAYRELQRFVVEFSWKSSAIEGNTYTIHETESLLTEGRAASGHTPAETAMVVNHKRAFDHVWQNLSEYRELTKAKILDLHQLLVADLAVPTGLRTHPVGITGTTYQPPLTVPELAGYFDVFIEAVNLLAEPAERALACLTLLPYLQPFVDGNKRTSRLLANAVLLSHDYPPISFFTADEAEYKGALLLFYEQGVLGNFRELVLQQLGYSAAHYFFRAEADGLSERATSRIKPGTPPLTDVDSYYQAERPIDR